jgi:hypothetical protein
MKTIKTYPTTIEADVARIALDAAAIPALVLGVAAGMEGGLGGVRLLVPDDQVEAALTVRLNC